MNRKNRKRVEWYNDLLERVPHQWQEQFADNSAVDADSAANMLAMLGIVPRDKVYYVTRQLSRARLLCDKWGRVHDKPLK